jgi:hypothetical protein
VTTLVADAQPVRQPLLRWLGRSLWRFLVLPALLLGGIGTAFVVGGDPGDRGFFDFKGGLWRAGVDILHGHDPYRAAYVAHQAAIMHAGGIAVGESYKHVFSVPLYPAPANLAAIAAMFGSLRLLGVRDWRCHLLVLISWPFLYGALLGAIGPFIVLGAAIAWVWRDRLRRPALAVGTIVALKVFPWTLGAWLLMTRRYKTLALAIVTLVVLIVGGWAIIGFQGMVQYPEMLSNATYIQEGRADGVATVMLVAGASPRLAQAIALLAGVALLGLAWRLRGGPDGDRRAFGLAIIASLVSTPIVWDHYMVLLFVPIALLFPRVHRLWTLPVIAQTLITLSYAIWPQAKIERAGSPDALHSAIGYLLVQAIITVYLCTTADQRAELTARWRTRLRRAPVGSAVTG